MSGLQTLFIKAKGAENRGETEAARALYQQVLDRFPNNRRAQQALEALDTPSGNQAQLDFDNMVAAYQAGQMAEAARYGQALSNAHPHAHGVHNLLGAALLALKDSEGAEAAFRRAIEADAKQLASYNNLAIALRQQGKVQEAEATYREVISLAPDYADAQFNLGNLLDGEGRSEEAAQCYEATIAVDPDYANAHYNLGNVHSRAGRREDAIACFAQAILLKPENSDAHLNLGSELLLLQRVDEALVAFDRALDINPANDKALINRGKAYVLKENVPEAVAAFRAALELDPTNRSARLQALFEEARICDWSKRGEFALTDGPRADAVQPFASLPFVDDPDLQYRRSIACAAKMFPAQPATLPDPAPSTDGRIRIGYFSADFHNHATMYLMSGFFREHDRSRFDVRLYSYGPQQEQDYQRQELLAHADAFTEIGGIRDEDVAELARRDNLDIAVDLKGYTRDTRSRIFGHRLAPIQVSYLGYPGTMGHEAYDYFIADHVTMPAGAERFFSEKIVRLAHCYQANDNQREIEPATGGRSEWGLPEDAFVFASFNFNYKISPAEWEIWMDLLQKVDRSVLWLLRSSDLAEQNLKREAQARGVDPDRLIFAEKVPHGEHLRRLALADLFLDTFAVNAHTTASDALWAGLPLVTLEGKQFAARVATSLLEAVGLRELAAETPMEYADLALSLATDADRLNELRKSLVDGRQDHPLFDTRGYTKRVEAAFAEMHRRRLHGQAPDHFNID